MDYIRVDGKGKWNRIPKFTGFKRCRLRWINYLIPGVKRGDFSEEENDELIVRLRNLLGNSWSGSGKNRQWGDKSLEHSFEQESRDQKGKKIKIALLHKFW
ncbi:hypothetical protein PTKIN_Ptkin05aG0155500 [Pterospermum kingtungense]